MSLLQERKLQNLLEHWPHGLVATSSWLKEMSISNQLAQRYLKSGWVESLGRGAYKRANDTINWAAGLASMQTQLAINVHLAGPSALAIQGYSHYLRLGNEKIFLLTQPKQKLPNWFMEYDWKNPIVHTQTSILPFSLATSKYDFNSTKITASSPERAILECLYLSPKHLDILECYQILEGLTTLRPKTLQELLELCKSIRVKRLFLFMASKAKLPVLAYLNLNKIKLGTGDRMLVKNGVYDAQYKISIPKELSDYA